MLKSVIRAISEQPFVKNSVTTTDATATTIMTIPIPNNSVCGLDLHVIGIKNDSSEGANYVIKGTYRNNAGTVSIVGTLSSSHLEEDDTNWDVALSVSSTNVLVKVTGVAATTINWKTRLLKTVMGV